ncbi:AraC family transcriptional regulator [Myxococcus sp. K38C18041901]|uniref:AraC family transcriptional regulator n=1 Tax=Myxococcus guangdongensis TaxID=2906760 RepID=UPI0020A71A8C|nr:AraC family transcriptional regulator [Myxococcus guangdongensis]MCP3063895.1 AraC family transcriptional regulator [Myxococcus guangdongensis]
MPRDATKRQVSTARYWVHPELPGLEAQHARYTRHTFAPHSHDAYSLVCMDQGAEALRFQGRTVVAPEGRLLVINPGQMHSGGAADPGIGWTYRILYIAPELLARAAEESSSAPRRAPEFATPLLDDALLLRRFSQVFATVIDASSCRLERDEALCGLLVELVRGHSTQGQEPTRVVHCAPGIRRARALIEAQVTRNIGLRELAREARLSPWHFVRAFRAQMGQTPQVYLRCLRVRHAQRLLATDMAMSEVALACGLADQSHLVKQFTRTLGVTPGQYRAAMHAHR